MPNERYLIDVKWPKLERLAPLSLTKGFVHNKVVVQTVFVESVMHPTVSTNLCISSFILSAPTTSKVSITRSGGRGDTTLPPPPSLPSHQRSLSGAGIMGQFAMSLKQKVSLVQHMNNEAKHPTSPANRAMCALLQKLIQQIQF